MNKKVKKFFKNFKMVRKLHQELIGQYLEERAIGVNVYEITSLKATKAEKQTECVRINLLIPTLRKDMVFGGISTALKFFHALADNGGYDRRIILTDSDVHEEDIQGFKDAQIVAADAESSLPFQIVQANDREFTKLSVRKRDIFIATTWWSAYILHDIIKWQNQEFNCKNELFYLIQDYEPGFYPWSSRYLLADSTYKMDEISTTAIFNTKILYDFFRQSGYQFHHEYYFEPVLNESLAKYIEEANQTKRKKQLIVYGRPGVDRNCFEILIGSLRKLLEINENARDWEYISLGEAHKNIELCHDAKLVSKGKVNLDEYAKIMCESAIGLSLMNSPHPSYPPLEMSTFGVKTITNMYANKDLSKFNNNIISISNCSFEAIAEELSKLVNTFNEHQEVSINEQYLHNTALFDDITNAIVQDLNT